MAISKKSATALAVRYAAFREAFKKWDEGDLTARGEMACWAGLLDEIQQKVGIELSSTAAAISKWSS